jgi:alkanesulfonate monooxygenase SsuD/methylene tetrahydromethanopterin reductase-like flavin-dependent oxidoreductase (luciferase family)
VVLATLRKKMARLAAEVGDGAVWANAARSYMRTSIAHLGEKGRSADFFVGNMIPTCIDDDRQAAAAVMKKILTGYVMLPNYQNYWIEAGYADEMEAIKHTIAAGEIDKVPARMSDRWLADCTLFGSVSDVRSGLEAWYDVGIKTPILVPSSTKGGQLEAIQELFGAFE